MAADPAAKPKDAACLACHESSKPKIKLADGKGEDGEPVDRQMNSINPSKYAKGAHYRMACADCHTEITDLPKPGENHVKAVDAKAPDCAVCHEDLWKKLQAEDRADPASQFHVVVQNIAAYRSSFHARPAKNNPERAKATCTDCHDTHAFDVPPRGTIARTEWHLNVPNVCGKKCHSDELDEWSESIHGKKNT